MRALMSVLLAASLFPGVVTASYLVVSAHEEGVFPRDPQIWRVEEEGTLVLVSEVPLDGGNVRKVELWRERGMLATWCRWEDGKPLGLRAKKCRVSLIDLHNPEEPLRSVIDCDPVFGGQLLAVNDSAVGVLTHGRRGRVADGIDVYAVTTHYGYLTEISSSGMMERLDLVRYNGSIPSRKFYGPLAVDLSSSGRLSYWYTVHTEPRPLSVTMPDSIVRMLAGAQWKDGTLGGGIFAQTDSALVLGFREQEGIDQRQVLLYVGNRDEWRVLRVPPGTVAQAFSEWVVLTYMTSEDRRKIHHTGYGVRSGPYRFVNWKDGRDWIEDGMGVGCEILEVWDEHVLYRKGQELIEGQIAGESVVDQRVLAMDPIIEDVYWGVAEGRLKK